jgi:hypothetical protein
VHIQVCSNHGPQGSDEATKGKTIFTYVYIEKRISRTSRPISIKLRTKYPSVKGIQNCSNKGTHPLQRGDDNRMGSFKNLLKNHWVRKAQIYMKLPGMYKFNFV